jgi:hypothetical protein
MQGKETHALDHFIAILILADFKGYPIDLFPALTQPLFFNPVKFPYE